jgi:hypothetical protein
MPRARATDQSDAIKIALRNTLASYKRRERFDLAAYSGSW